MLPNILRHKRNMGKLTEPSLEEGTKLADGLAAAETHFVTALLVGLPLIVAALLMGRANRDLFERELAPVLRGLSRGPRDSGHLGEYPSSLWIDIVGVTGVVLAIPALAGFALLSSKGYRASAAAAPQRSGARPLRPLMDGAGFLRRSQVPERAADVP